MKGGGRSGGVFGDGGGRRWMGRRRGGDSWGEFVDQGK